MIILVMGVCGAGKTTVGKELAQALGAYFLDADDFHSTINREKMAQATPLTDEDRQEWLAAIANKIALLNAEGRSAVLACSALKQCYRNLLISACSELVTVWLHGDAELIACRLAERQGHFMPASLLSSQLAIIEAPVKAIKIDVIASPAEIVKRILAYLMTLRQDPKLASQDRGALCLPTNHGGYKNAP